MIIKNLAALCRKRKVIYVHEDQERDIQWVGDGRCMYPLFGIPHMTEEQIKVLFDIPEDKRGEVRTYTHDFERNMGYSFEDGAADNPVVRYGITFGGANGAFTPVSTSDGIAFYEEDVFRPLNNPNAILYERYRKDGTLYFVMKAGMMVEALIFPAIIKEAELLDVITDIQQELQAKVDAGQQEDQEEADAGN